MAPSVRLSVRLEFRRVRDDEPLQMMVDGRQVSARSPIRRPIFGIVQTGYRINESGRTCTVIRRAVAHRSVFAIGRRS
jgi:hypothetical protein